MPHSADRAPTCFSLASPPGGHPLEFPPCWALSLNLLSWFLPIRNSRYGHAVGLRAGSLFRGFDSVQIHKGRCEISLGCLILISNFTYPKLYSPLTHSQKPIAPSLPHLNCQQLHTPHCFKVSYKAPRKNSKIISRSWVRQGFSKQCTKCANHKRNTENVTVRTSFLRRKLLKK